jgi:PTS system galactitol-specific IIC component
MFTKAIQFILDLGGNTMLPIMITLLGLYFRMNFFDALRNGLMIGIGFIGINTVIGLLVTAFSPVTAYYSGLGGVGFTVIDIGWEGISRVAWGTSFALLVVPIGVVLNFLLVRMRFTKTLNVDIWNYYHPVLTAAIAFYMLVNLGVSTGIATMIGTIVGVAFTVIACKAGDFYAKDWQEYYGLPGTSCTTIDQTLTMWPISWLSCKLVDLIPAVNKINIDINWVSEKFGALGESSILAFIIGLFLSFITKQDIGSALTMSVDMAAAIVLMPRMVSLLMEGLAPIANAARAYMQKKLGDDYEIYIGMDEALGLGDEVGIAVSLIMIPITIALAFIIPGVNFFPIGALGSLIYVGAANAMYAKGDVFRTIVGSTAYMAYTFVTKSFMATVATDLAYQTGVITDISQMITGSSVNEIQCVIMGIIGKILGAF